jgi:hypothetical protein
MVCYVVGLVACGLAFLSGYLTQFWLYNECDASGRLH